MHIYAKGLTALMVTLALLGCGSRARFSDKGDNRSADSSSDAVGVAGLPDPEGTQGGSEGDDVATVEVVPEGSIPGNDSTNKGATDDTITDGNTTAGTDGTTTDGNTPAGGNAVVTEGGTPTTPEEGTANRDGGPGSSDATHGDGNQGHEGKGKDKDKDKDDNGPKSPIENPTEVEVGECQGGGRVHFVSERNNQLITADELAVAKVSGNQSTFSITITGATLLKAFCLFVTGNQSRVTVNFETSVTSVKIKTRGNQNNVALNVPAGVTITTLDIDKKGKEGDVTIAGAGTYTPP